LRDIDDFWNCPRPRFVAFMFVPAVLETMTSTVQGADGVPPGGIRGLFAT